MTHPAPSVRAGVWIDHRRAVVVTIAPGGETTVVVDSDFERQLGRTNGVRSNEKHEALHTPKDDSQDRRFHGLLDAYYDRVIAALHGAGTVLIFGPGEAKGEMRKRLAKGDHARTDVTVETADRMTDPEVAARVRDWSIR